MSALCIGLLATGFQAPGARPALRSIAIVASEPSEPQSQAEFERRASDIFTLEEREDGWDDVRGGIKAAIKDRKKGYYELKDNYIDPARRYGKAIAEMTSEAIRESEGLVVPTLPSLPSLSSLSKPELRLPTKESAIQSLGDVLDAVGDAREAAQKKPAARAPAQKKPAAREAVRSSAPIEAPIETPFNALLFFSLPVGAITALAVYILSTTFGIPLPELDLPF